MQRELTALLEAEAFPGGQIEVSRLEGREAISRLFSIEILAVCKEVEGIEIDEIVGAEATLVLSREGAVARRIHGMIAKAHDRLDTETVHSSYLLTFVPRAYRLSLVETCDVFLDISLPELLRLKLGYVGLEEGKDFELRLYDKYPAREFIVQYKETDLAFLSRLTEHVGISFFFEHQSGRDVIVFTDHNDGFSSIEGESQVPARLRGDRRDVFELAEEVRVIPELYVVHDYNYRTPQVAPLGRAQVPAGVGGVIEYGAHVKTPEEAEKLAHVRAQERLAQRRVFLGKADVERFSAGAKLTLVGHPKGDMALLLTEVTYKGSFTALGTGAPDGGEAMYVNEFSAIRASRLYRPQRLTPRPRIHGVISAFIDAESKGQYAEMDDQGRYKVRFLFDTGERSGGKASRFVRMAQPHAGQGYGIHFPLRPDVEVLITFIDGDPDRPIIASTVPNPQNASPVTAGNAPRNVIRTGGGNEINIDDSHDKHRVKISTPHKNTTFQLGYRNSPEDGAMLETWGSSSNVALAGHGTFSSVNATLSAIDEFRKGGSITSIAERPDFVTAVTSVTEIISSLLETAKAGLETANGAWETAIAKKKQDSIEAQVKAKNAYEEQHKAREKANKADEAIRAALEEAAKSNDPQVAAAAAANLAKMDAYKAAMEEYEKAQLSLRTNQEFLRDAVKGEKPGTYVAETETYQQAVAADQQAVADAKAKLDAARAAVQGMPKLEDPPELKALDKEQEGYKEAIGEEENALKDSNDAWDDGLEAKRKYDEAIEDKEFGPDAQRLKAAGLVASTATTATALFSDVLKLYTVVKELFEKLGDMKKKAAAQTAATLSFARERPVIFAPKKGRFFPVRHTLGSKGDMLLYGKNNLFVWGEKATVFGVDSLTLVADKEAYLLSHNKAEIATNKELKATSTKIDILADDELLLTAKPRLSAPHGVGKITALAKDKIDVTSQKADITLEANTTAGQAIKILAKSQITGTTEEITLTASKVAKVVSGSFNLTVDGQGSSAKLGDAAWRLSIKPQEVKLGGPGYGVKVTDSATNIHSPGANVKLAGTNVDLTGQQVKVNGSRIMLG